MELYRCSKCQNIRELTGEGSYLYGGRWNSKGTRLVYCSSSAAMALLETLVHTSRLLPGMDFCMLKLSIDERSMETIPVSGLPEGWNNTPPADELKFIGDQFVRHGKHLLLRLPSAILPMEWNYLVNPEHPLFSKLKVEEPVRIGLDRRLESKLIS